MVSFDIDGTLEVGDPPGPISLDTVREARRRGYVIGTSSDRTVSEQLRLWEHQVGMEADFVGHKHHLGETKERFDCVRRVHIGDTHVDEYYAKLAGFEFFYADQVPEPGTDGWIF
jgi:hypothetical protein